MKNSKVLITGASGFIGTNLLAHLKSLGHTVINLDILPPKNNEQLSLWEKTDITNYKEFLHKATTYSPDYIVHLAARTDLKGKTLDDYHVNTVGTENMLKIIPYLSSLKKIVVTSLMLVCRLGYKPENQFDFHPTQYMEKVRLLQNN
jgi:nucleoside-diphosphate-sugar epimerase